MRAKHYLAGKVVALKLKAKDPQIKDGDYFRIEDWWENVSGKSWMNSDGNPTAMNYGMRSGFAGLPTDNEVVYGKVEHFGHLIHSSELGEEVTTSDSKPKWEKNMNKVGAVAQKRIATIRVVGESIDDLLFGIDEVKREIARGYKGGGDSLTNGKYEFEVTERISTERERNG